jgi:PAS domain S-box-containing protein
MFSRHLSRAGPFIAVSLAAASWLIFDAMTPEIIEVTPFYITVVLVGYWFPQPKASFALLPLAALLIITGHWITIPSQEPNWEDWLNRGLSISTLLLAAVFVWYIRVLEQELHASKERRQLALDTAQVGWWQYDPRRRVALGDARFKEIYDLTADKIPIEIPLEEIRKLVHPDDAERFWSDRQRMLDPAGPHRSTGEYRVQRKDGTVCWVQVSWLTYLESVGGERRVASVVGTVFDITERKQREEREHLLLREANHRAKNLIGVVDAIARQTATKNPEDFIERFSHRLQALSANQDLLVRSEWKGVDIKGLVHAQLAHFADLIGSRISVDGPRLRVKADAAQAIGLALHELATNAGKYGALSTDTGRVDVRWGTDDEFTMSWTEREGPPVSTPLRRGFGSIVTEAMAERSVAGVVDLDYAPSGLTWRLTCRAANVLELWERQSISKEREN